MDNNLNITPKVLGLDISTKTIGWALFDKSNRELLELTHFSPKLIKDSDSKTEELFMKSEMFRDKLIEYKSFGIETVIIEAPLLNSNNAYTVQLLLRYNTLISKEIYDILNVVPEYISTYESRFNAFPELVKENSRGKKVLFGGLPRDIDKKFIIWEKVSKLEPQIEWSYNKNNILKKECFDMSDAYTCVLGFMKSKNIW